MKKILRRQHGFTMMEVIIASGIGVFMVAGLMTMLNTSIKENQKMDQENDGWMEASQAAANVSVLFKNIPRLEPPEDLIKPKDGLYTGFAPLPAENIPAKCEVHEHYAAVRISSLAAYRKSERLVNSWHTNSAGKKSGELTWKDELRLSYLKDPKTEKDRSIFDKKTSIPKELYIVDADGVFKRRFYVRSFKINKDTDKNPHTNTTSIDPVTKKNRLYSYVSVILDKPRLLDGKEMDVPPFKILDQSVAYPIDTQILCVAKPEGMQGPSLIQIKDAGTQYLLSLGNGNLYLNSFKVEFAAAEEKLRFDQLKYFFADFFTNAMRECVNAARFSVDILSLKPGEKREEKLKERLKANPAGSGPLGVSRSVVLENFTQRRPSFCK